MKHKIGDKFLTPRTRKSGWAPTWLRKVIVVTTIQKIDGFKEVRYYVYNKILGQTACDLKDCKKLTPRKKHGTSH